MKDRLLIIKSFKSLTFQEYRELIRENNRLKQEIKDLKDE